MWRSSAFILSAALANVLSNDLFVYKNKVLDHSFSEDGTLFAGGFYTEFYAFHQGRGDLVSKTLKFDGSGNDLNDQIIKSIERVCKLPQNVRMFLKREQLNLVWKEYTKICKRNDPITNLTVDYELAIKIMQGNPFAQYLISQAAKKGAKEFNLYRVGDYIGYPEGPVFSSSDVLVNKVELNQGSSHFTLEEEDLELYSNKFNYMEPTLNRITGMTLFNKDSIDKYLANQASMTKNDHRVIGKDQDLFMMHTLSPGSPFFLIHGTRIVNRILNLIRNKYSEYGFDEVITPQIYLKSLWETSGHWENYKKDMFGVVDAYTQNSNIIGESDNGPGCCSNSHDSGDIAAGLKPMNCPGHCLIFSSKVRSYRDLPLRLADLSPLHRNEPVGSLSGLTRVRRFHQDDGHIFCSHQDIQEEIYKQLKMLDEVYSIFKFNEYSLCLSTRPLDHYIGSETQWNEAENMLKSALRKAGREWTENKGDGAFYGPKIDIHVKDALGRNHQTATIQLDFQLPKRFKLKFVGKDGSREEPVIIHRAILGSVERMMAILSEHYRGRWPFWMSPRQAMVVPILPKESKDVPEEVNLANQEFVIEYAKKVHRSLLGGNFSKSEHGGESIISVRDSERDKSVEFIESRMKNYRFYVDLDSSLGSTKLGRVVKDARLSRYNYLLAVGVEEAKQGLVNVRSFNSKEIGVVTLTRLQELFMEMSDNFD
ncbi:Threonine-tRNA ligase, cytoplasmic [Smittium mucronatum]|uniref:threonine--tRNA ligase n=1 Tax=Smittium mucronatum TaxID=133383 RepID=A0A1R0GLM8_9FUNG|nr:Threonine-tRNA ligase, cytoplasmic [Smittium mucronatum]